MDCATTVVPARSFVVGIDCRMALRHAVQITQSPVLCLTKL